MRARKKRGVRRLTGEGESGEGVQKVDVGETPMVGDSEEDADGMQMRTARSNA
jgi:hypothetical protein